MKHEHGRKHRVHGYPWGHRPCYYRPGVLLRCTGHPLFALPRVEAEQIRIHFIGLDITAGGLGAVIFAVGLAVCYLGQRTIPMHIETTSGKPLWTPTRRDSPALPELTAVLDALQRNATRFEPAKAKEGVGMSVAEGHMAIPTAARQLASVRRTSESITHGEGTRKPPTRTD